MDDEHLPAARVVREAGAVIATPRIPLNEQLRRAFAPLASTTTARLRDVAAVVIGLWPITAIMAVAGALIWAAGVAGSP